MLNYQQFRNRNMNRTSDENELRRLYYVYTNNALYEQSLYIPPSSAPGSGGGRKGIQEVTVAPGGSTTVNLTVGTLISFIFTGGLGTTASVTVDSTTFLIENATNQLVFDSDDANGQEYTFTTIDETRNFVTGDGTVFTVTWTGVGSLFFTMTGIEDDTVNKFVEDNYISDYYL